MLDEQGQYAYQRALQAAVWIARPAVGRIWSDGATRVDLPHRMSTNDLRNMKAGEGRATVFTNAVAKIIDRVIVIELGERALLLTQPGRGDTVRQWLNKYIFFNDDITLTDAGESLGQVDVYGPQAAALVRDGLGIDGLEALDRYHARQAGGVLVVRGDDLAGGGYWVIAPPDRIEAFTAWLAARDIPEGDETLLAVLRVEAGLPGPEGELNEGYIPLETALWDDVSFSKGCYIGQEIIARMESRGRLAKTLVGVQAAAALETGASLRGPEGERGTLTSAVWSPRFGWLGLGFIKPTAAEPGTALTVEAADAPVNATVVALPLDAAKGANA